MRKKYYPLILSILAIVAAFLPIDAQAANKYGIVIDGEFSDWSSLPMTELSFSYENGQNIKYASLVSDESNLYFYLNMAPLGHNYHDLQTAGHTLTIGNKVFYMSFIISGQSVIGQTRDVQASFWAEDGSVNTTVPGKLTRVKTDFSDTSYSDEVEVEIPFEKLKVEATSSQTITYKNTNLGEQTIIITGGSTGPWILAGIAVVIAGYSFWKFRGRSPKTA